jgi:hypothetical protein
MAEPFFLADKLQGFATILSAPAAMSGTQASNIFRHEPGMVFRTASAGANALIEVIFDAGRLIEWDTLAFIGGNLRPGDKTSLHASATDPAVPLIVENLMFTLDPLPARNPPTPTPPKIVRFRSAPISHRYFRVRHMMGDTAHPDGYQQIGTVLLGKRFSFGQDMDANASVALLDPSPVVDGPGFEDAERFQPYPNWRVSFSYISDAQWWDFFGFLRSVGETQRVLFVPEPDLPGRHHETVTFGRLKQVSGRHPIYNAWQAEINVLGAQP